MSSYHSLHKNSSNAAIQSAQRAADRRWSALAQATGQIIWTTPADGLVTDLPYWRAFTGQTAAEVVGWGWLSALHPDDRDSATSAWNHALEHRIRYQAIYRVRRSDGVYRTMQATAIPLIEADNVTISEWVGACNDITEQQLTQQEKQRLLQQSEAATAQAEQQANEITVIFNAITDGIIIYDQNSRIVRMNAAARKMFLFDNMSDSIQESVHERARYFAVRDQLRQPLTPENWPVSRLLHGDILTGTDDFWVQNPDGSEREITITGTPIRTSDGEIIGAIAINRDITERRQLEQSAHASLQALLRMAESLIATDDKQLPVTQRLAELMTVVLNCPSVSIIALEEDGRGVPLAITGLTDELRDQWLTAASTSAAVQYIVQSPLHERLLTGEAVVVSSEDPLFQQFQPEIDAYGLHANVIAPMLVGDTLIGLVSMSSTVAGFHFTEVSLSLLQGVARLAALTLDRDHLLHEREEAKAMVLALSESRRRMNEFLGIASHELRTPLTTITANVQFADRTVTTLLANYAEDIVPNVYTTIERLDIMLKRANKQVKRMDRFIGDLLDISHIDAGQLELVIERMNLVTIVADIIQEQQAIVPIRTIMLDLNQVSEVYVMADAARLAQVLINFMTNALKYSASDQPVTVCLIRQETQVIIEVTDKGPGIPLEEQGHVWDRFHRVPGIELQSGSGIGLGLGLYISHTIIAQLRGNIGVRSKVGEGSTFWFSLPIVP